MPASLLEFAFIEDVFDESMSAIFANKPDGWELLQVGNHRWKHDVQDFDGPPGWRLEAFTLWLQGSGVLADCFESHVTADDDGWHYAVRGVDLAEGGYTMDLLHAGVIVRDVPPPLLVNCEVTVTENTKYKALFTTLAGSELATVQEDLPPLLMVGHLLRHAKTHAGATGHLRRKNREVWLLINGSVYPLSAPTVLWNKSKGDGMPLLRRCQWHAD